MAHYHVPALLPQCLDALDINPDGIYVDATFGGGGHSRAIVERLSQKGHLFAFDQDIDAIANSFSDPRLTITHGNFRFIRNFMKFYGVDKVDGILADLGVSFHHFDDPERGFSFRFDGPLDMRMNRNAPLTAAKVLADYTEEQLADLFYLYGEIKQARRIATAITAARAKEPIITTERFMTIIEPFADPRRRKKELAQIFQALRLEVNNELDALRHLLDASLKVLRPKGRLAVITYHSLEDRLVKNFMKTGNVAGKEEKDFFGKNLSPMKLLTSKPIVPDSTETEANPRSRSAHLRVAEMLCENHGKADNT